MIAGLLIIEKTMTRHRDEDSGADEFSPLLELLPARLPNSSGVVVASIAVSIYKPTGVNCQQSS